MFLIDFFYNDNFICFVALFVSFCLVEPELFGGVYYCGPFLFFVMWIVFGELWFLHSYISQGVFSFSPFMSTLMKSTKFAFFFVF